MGQTEKAKVASALIADWLKRRDAGEELDARSGNEHNSFLIPVADSQAEIVFGSHNNNRSGLGDIAGKPHDANATTSAPHRVPSGQFLFA